MSYLLQLKYSLKCEIIKYYRTTYIYSYKLCLQIFNKTCKLCKTVIKILGRKILDSVQCTLSIFHIEIIGKNNWNTFIEIK